MTLGRNRWQPASFWRSSIPGNWRWQLAQADANLATAQAKLNQRSQGPTAQDVTAAAAEYRLGAGRL